MTKRSDIRAAVERGLSRRRRRDRLVRRLGLGAILLGLGFLAFMFFSIIGMGYSAFWQTRIQLPVELDPAAIDPERTHDPAVLRNADYAGLIKQALRKRFPQIKKRKEKRKLYQLVSSGAAYALACDGPTERRRCGSTPGLWLANGGRLKVITRIDAARQVGW